MSKDEVRAVARAIARDLNAKLELTFSDGVELITPDRGPARCFEFGWWRK